MESVIPHPDTVIRVVKAINTHSSVKSNLWGSVKKAPSNLKSDDICLLCCKYASPAPKQNLSECQVNDFRL